MFPKLVLLAPLMLIMSGGAALAEDQSRYWVITGAPEGKFFYRNTPGERIPLVGDFTAFFESSAVWCEAEPCELSYASPHFKDPQKLKLKLIPKRWTSLATAQPKPESPVLPLSRELAVTGRRAGREKGGLCSGTVAVRAPACDELVDIGSFSVEWTPPPGGKGRVEIRLTQMDLTGNAVEEFPPVVAQIEDGRYSSAALRDHLARIQRNDGRVRLRIDLRRSGPEHATRTILIPTIQEQDAFRKKMREMDVPNAMLRRLGSMWVALQAERWTTAAQEAIRLQGENNASPELRIYALAGLCQSGYDDNRETLRTTIAAADSAHICATAAGSSGDSVSNSAMVQLAKSRRTGLALLIGNSNYPEDQLDAVRHDIEGVSGALLALGFEVVEAPNLDTTQEFRQTVANFLRGASADDVVLVYYSGHGMQFKGKTYLLGKNYAQVGQSALAALSNAFKLDDLVEQIEDAPPFARIVVFDACRSNIFSKDSIQQGDVSFRRKYPNLFIMLANKPGRTVAARAAGEFRSPFTEGLIHGFSNAKGGLLEIFTVAAEKTRALNPGQEPELLTSDPDRLDPAILSGSGNKAKSNRAQEMLDKACPYYHSRTWDTYLPMMRVAKVLSEDQHGQDPNGAAAAVQARLSAEIAFAEVVRKAEAEEASEHYEQSAKSWKEASTIFPGRNWVRLRAALAALAIDDVQGALVELAAMPAGPDASIPARANLLWADLARSFPKEAALGRSAATEPRLAEQPECVVKR